MFLNFIIAEVSASYQAVKDIIDVTILQERAQLINESEDMLKAIYGTKLRKKTNLFPRYLVSRQVDDWNR